MCFVLFVVVWIFNQTFISLFYQKQSGILIGLLNLLDSR